MILLLLFEEIPSLQSLKGRETVRLDEESGQSEITIEFQNTKLEERETNKCH